MNRGLEPESHPAESSANAKRHRAGTIPGQRAALWLVAVSAAWTIVALVRVLPYLPTSGGDFEHLHRSAAALVSGQGAYLHPELDYPPLFPVLLAPLGFLSLDAARFIWLGISIAAVLAAMAAIWRLAGSDVVAASAVAVALAIEGTALPNLALGQTNPMLLLLLAVALLLHRSRPARAAAAIGLAAALKIWPGLLLLSFLAGGRKAIVATWRSGLLTWALLVALPFGLLAVATPSPHLPPSHGFWLGTPALLNFSAPAAVLRASYDWEPGGALPADWVNGVTATWSLDNGRRLRSVLSSLVTLGAGLAALGMRWRRVRGQRASDDTDETDEFDESPGVALTGALVALALVAAPIAWYHYQLLQLPAFVLAFAAAFRARRWGVVVALAVLLATLTRHEWVVAAVGLFEPDPTTALYCTGLILPLAGTFWFASRVLALSRVRPPETSARAVDRQPST
ncbi:MAG: glycosyltransferase 87 family protein [Thermoanaerobaculia bacterium]